MEAFENGFRPCYLNSAYNLCDSYPKFIIEPNSVSDEDISKIKKFRSSGRVMALSWCKGQTGLYRSSQPMVGIMGGKCVEDQRYFVQSGIRYVVDARPKISARANKLRGKGYEHPDIYTTTKIHFMGIVNIHKVKDSSDALLNIYDREDFLIELHSSKWLKYLRYILLGAQTVVDIIERIKSSVLVHCSDGWDRTPQITSLAQLLMDPFYRKIHGFKVLVNKEWFSFGHKFRERTAGAKQSPVFIQFLDCVHQLLVQHLSLIHI